MVYRWFAVERVAERERVSNVAAGNADAEYDWREFPIGQYGGLYYRVRMGVRWNVGSTVLGTASYAFDYSSLNAFGGAWAGQIGAMSEAVCWIP